MADAASREQISHPILHRPAAKSAHRHRLPGQKRLDPRPPLRLGPQLRMAGRKNVVHLTDKAHVAIIVGKGTDMHRRHLAKALQDMVRPNLVAPVGGPGDTVREEQYLAHQPRPLAIHGPNQLAIGNGSFCHIAIFALYFGLFGLTSRGSCPSAV